MIATRRARGDADAKRTHWSLIAPRPRSVPLRAGNPKNFLPIFCGSSPDPSAERRKEERKFLVCVDGSVSKSSVRSFHFPNSAFSDFPPPRGARVYRCVVTTTSAHTAHTSHRPLTFVRVDCSVCAVVRLVASFESVIFKVVCADAQASLYVLVPPSQYAHKSVRGADGSLKNEKPAETSFSLAGKLSDSDRQVAGLGLGRDREVSDRPRASVACEDDGAVRR